MSEEKTLKGICYLWCRCGSIYLENWSWVNDFTRWPKESLFLRTWLCVIRIENFTGNRLKPSCHEQCRNLQLQGICECDQYSVYSVIDYNSDLLTLTIWWTTLKIRDAIIMFKYSFYLCYMSSRCWNARSMRQILSTFHLLNYLSASFI